MRIVRALVIAGLAIVAGCKKDDGGGAGTQGAGTGAAPPGPRAKVAVSIFPLYDVTRRIAGDRFDVILVLPPGKSEHGYDPTPKEVARLDGAKLGITVGLDMDGWVEKIMASAGNPRIVQIGDKVATIPIDVEPIGEGEEHDDHDDHDDHDGKGDKDGKDHDDHADKGHDDHADHAAVGAPDPHFWMDPDRMAGVVDAIAAELTTLDPTAAEAIATQVGTVKAAFAALDAAIAARAKMWTKRTIVTFHGSMAYFAKRYNLRIAAVVEPLAGKEPTAAYIAEVLAAIKRGKAAALFSEPQLDPAPARTIAREAGIPLGELDPVGGVLGRDSYEALITWNTDQLEKALK